MPTIMHLYVRDRIHLLLNTSANHALRFGFSNHADFNARQYKTNAEKHWRSSPCFSSSCFRCTSATVLANTRPITGIMQTGCNREPSSGRDNRISWAQVSPLPPHDLKAVPASGGIHTECQQNLFEAHKYIFRQNNTCCRYYFTTPDLMSKVWNDLRAM